MSSAITRLGQPAVSALILLLGCTTATRIDYAHDPTESIKTDPNLNRAELAPFTVDGVVVAPFLRILEPQGTQVWLTLWATNGKTASVRTVQLSGTGAKSAQIQQFPEEKTVTTDKTNIKGVQHGDILVGLVGSDALASMASEGRAKLTLDLRVSAAVEYRHFRMPFVTSGLLLHWYLLMFLQQQPHAGIALHGGDRCYGLEHFVFIFHERLNQIGRASCRERVSSPV